MILKTKQKIALARLMQWPVLTLRQCAGRGAQVVARRDGINWALDLREGIDFAIYLTGKFERQTMGVVAGIVGAGDTVIAAFTLALIAGGTPETAARLANYAAGKVVSKAGTATVSLEELREAVHEDGSR